MTWSFSASFRSPRARLLIAGALALCLVFVAPARAAEEKKKEQPKLSTPLPSSPEWKLEVLLEKPKIHVPSVVCQTPDGRILVAEDPMDQFGPGDKPIDRVLCIFPDGRITVFAEKLYAVFGLAYIDGKVHVHHSPKYTVYEDDPAGGVGRNPVYYYDSDNPATWGAGNLNDHIPAQMRLGMDGWLYMSVGDKGIYGLVSNIDKSAVELRGGGVVRFRPEGTNFEVYSSGTRNHLDLSMNAEDEIFSYDNTDDGLGWNTRFTHMVEGGFYGYPYDYRPHPSDGDGMARLNAMRDRLSKAKALFAKLRKHNLLRIDFPIEIVPPFYGHTLWAMTDFGGGSPCGAVGYNEDALPPEYRGNLFHCEWGKKQVERIAVERVGGTYRIIRRDAKFLKGGTQPFRPLGICVTNDGMGFLIADWNWDGWNSKNDAGRLMKLTYTGKSHAKAKPAWFIPASMGQKFEATAAELVEALKHPAQSVRLVAQRRIGERAAAEVVPLLVKLLKDKAAPNHARWSAIWTLDRIEDGRAGRDTVMGVVADAKQDVTVRMQAARQLGTRRAREAVPALVAALSDKDAALRFRAATALGRIGDAKAVGSLVKNLTDADFFARYATFTALNRIGKTSPSAWPLIVTALSSERPQSREAATYAMGVVYDAALVSALANYIKQTSNPSQGRAAAIGAIAPLFKQPKPWNGKWWATQPVNGLPPAREIEWAGTADAQSALRSSLHDGDPAIRAAAIVALRTAPDPTVTDRLVHLFNADKDLTTKKNILRALTAGKSPAATPLAVELLRNAKSHPDLLPDVMKLAATLGGPDMLDALIAMIGGDDSALAADVLVLACETLGKMKDAKAVPALSIGIAHKDEKVATAATGALGQITGDASLKALLSVLKDGRTPIRRAAALAIGAHKSKEAIDPLLAICKDKDVKKEAITALAATPTMKALEAYLEGLAGSDASLRSTARRAIRAIQKEALAAIEARLDTNPLPTQAVSELQDLYKRFVPENERTSKLWKFDTKKLSPEAFANFAKSHPGNPDAGQKVFRSENLSCIKCHKVGEEGGDVGPALAGVGAKYDRNFLVESILYPSRQILDGYHQTIVRLKDRDVQAGVVRGETDADLTLFDGSAEKYVIKKTEIQGREHSKLSVMPEGLHAVLKPEEFADLIAYLESLKK